MDPSILAAQEACRRRLGMLRYYRIHTEARLAGGPRAPGRSNGGMSLPKHIEKPIWSPDPARVSATRMHQFTEYAGAVTGLKLDTYEALWEWSVGHREAFWSAVWSFCGVRGSPGQTVLVDGDRLPGARWFPAARLNFAQNLLAHASALEAPALVFWGEDKIRRQISYRELYAQVAATAAALRTQGITAGDRVAAFMPNLPETLVAMLAAASIGAVFTSTSPDFGVQGVLDRFGQTRPRILFAVDGYWYNGKAIDCTAKLADLIEHLPSVERVVLTRYLHPQTTQTSLPRTVMFEEFVALHAAVQHIEFTQLAFDHPLYILYSSGTTGIPKGIVHGAGGTLLQHLKEHQLHCDVRPGDRYFYFTTCGWTMWNILASALASGATLLLYDGSPFVRGGRILFDFAQEERMTHFGTSAKFVDALAKEGLRPVDTHDLSSVRVFLSTGSPLVPESYDYVYDAIKSDMQLSSMSGGTDICSAFVIGSPTLPVWRGEIQCKGLGMAVDVYDPQGRPLPQGKGELVCTRAFPSMPIGFWNDPDGTRLRSAYFERFPNVWCHGDFCEMTPHGGMLIHGRSDATLNPAGVRIGTAEIYRQVEKLPEVLESIAIGQKWQGDVRVVLFVRLAPGIRFSETLAERIRDVIRANTTPRHVPARIVEVADIPRTKSGKLVELAVRNVVHGEPVNNLEALANPEALELFRGRSELDR
ncbi:MAG: acetoacetate--CoA ligase [Gammaproteobacteria bacterium]|jgi:acetoacetyl-CoA synthetase|nr:acetoacetate--CoA ligase [Gammaproteobacteria bacterium]